jgi:Papain-like cysteine protease AvrRpt2
LRKGAVMSVIETTRVALDLNSREAQSDRTERLVAIESFTMQEQCHSNWCWAAVAASVATYYNQGRVVRQCEVGDLDLKRDDCCQHPCGEEGVDFNVTNVLASPLNRLRCLERFARKKRATPDEVLEELAAGRPLCARTVWRDGGAHFVTIVGYRPDTEETGTLVVDDPFWGRSEHSYDGFAEHYQLFGGKWSDTYFTERPGG